MKKFAYILVLSIAILATSSFKRTSAQTSGEQLAKAIYFHDPLQKWNDYAGKVHLITAFPGNRNSGGEIIEIQTKENFYQYSRIAAKTIRGIKKGECFQTVDGGNKNLSEDECKTIRQMKGWHYFHFAILMELKTSGLILGDKVETVKFQGNDCLAITFTYDPVKTKNDFYKGSNWTVYLDPANYSMKGFKEEGMMNFYAVFSGILNVNGIKIPLCRTYFKNADDSFYMVDLFSSEEDK
ncbi:MAG: hypothetical protein A2X03_13005 [Bacteroidetes bacterium GWA2_40_15]|nr:MAG: hypothetical protein A2X03_13005 [Bacteroidetes bacterium GWA2_40_15]HCU21287.1 hypothetical protein [Bacteroidales bacterium]